MSRTFRKNYIDVQIIARRIILEARPELQEHEFFDDIVHEMVQTILEDMYSKYTEREIRNALTLLLSVVDEGIDLNTIV